MAVHGSEPHVRHLVQLVQLGHDPLADLARVDLILALLQELRLQLVHQGVDPLRGDGALLGGAQEPVQDLLPAEGLAPSVFLDDQERRGLHRLVGGEAPLAGQALPAAADRMPLLRGARVDHLVLEVAAGGTLHCIIPAVKVSTAPVPAARTWRAPVTVSDTYSPSTTRSGNTTLTGEPGFGMRDPRNLRRSIIPRSSSIASLWP